MALIRRVADLHNERKDKLAKIIQREMGKPLDQSVGEVEFSASIYEFYADNAASSSPTSRSTCSTVKAAR